MAWYCIAKEGVTCDDRNIEARWLVESAEQYDKKEYTARINCEHCRGWSPDDNWNRGFKAYGDVEALKAEKGEDGKMRLYAQLSPTPELVELSKKRQKVFTSCEFDTSFAGTGKAYLVGLAVTDSPASLGTTMLQFCAFQRAAGNASPLDNRKLKPGNLFTAAEEAEMRDFVGAFTAVGVPEVRSGNQKGDSTEGASLLNRLVDFVASKKEKAGAESASDYVAREELEQALKYLAESNEELKKKVESLSSASKERIEVLGRLKEMEDRLAERRPSFKPVADGSEETSGSAIFSDC